MKSKIGIFIIGLAILSMLLTIAPKVSSETLLPDLIISVQPIPVTHGPLANYHTAWVSVKNVGTYAADPWWHTKIYLQVKYASGITIQSLLLDFNHTIGLPVGWTRLIVHTFYWDNPDPTNTSARIYAYTDVYNEVAELNESNNKGYSEWWH